MKIAVVGAGIIGESCAWRLAERDHTVTLFDARPAGHAQGSSHGRSRIVRRTYDDPFYTAIMTDAYPMWREVETIAGEALINERGLFMFGSEESQMLVDAEAAMTEEGVTFSQVANLSVGPRLTKGERGIFIREGGWVRADRALDAIRKRSSELGVLSSDQAVKSLDDLAAFEKVIVAPGPWIRDWVPDLDVQVTHQTFAYLSVATPCDGPVWIHDVPELFYGFPSEPGASTVKIGFHTSGGSLKSPSERPEPDPHQLEALVKEARERFDFTGQVEAHRCLYTRTASEDFRIGRLDDKSWFISACSGHAFKMGPWLGKLMADLVEEKQDLDNWPRFRWPRV